MLQPDLPYARFVFPTAPTVSMVVRHAASGVALRARRPQARPELRPAPPRPLQRPITLNGGMRMTGWWVREGGRCRLSCRRCRRHCPPAQKSLLVRPPALQTTTTTATTTTGRYDIVDLDRIGSEHQDAAAMRESKRCACRRRLPPRLPPPPPSGPCARALAALPQPGTAPCPALPPHTHPTTHPCPCFFCLESGMSKTWCSSRWTLASLPAASLWAASHRVAPWR